VDTIGVRIPAPKRYQPAELIRLIHASVAQEIPHPGAGLRSALEVSRGRRHALRRPGVGIAFVVAASLLLLWWTSDREELSFSSDSEGLRIGTMTIVLFVAFGVWLGFLLRAGWRILWSLRRELSFDRLRQFLSSSASRRSES
jgi:hypothetical protein